MILISPQEVFMNIDAPQEVDSTAERGSGVGEYQS